jgi:hypothetical protein
MRAVVDPHAAPRDAAAACIVDFQATAFAHLDATFRARAELPLLCCREHPIRVKSEGVMSDINYMAFVEHRFSNRWSSGKILHCTTFYLQGLIHIFHPSRAAPFQRKLLISRL